MALRRMTRSLCKTVDQHQQHQEEAASANRKKKNKTKELSQEMELVVGSEELEAALNPAADYMPACFQSQPRSAPSSQLPGLSFDSDLLSACDSAPDATWFDMKFEFCDSTPGTQLEMVSGMEQGLHSSSLLLSPAPTSPPSPQPGPQLTSAEELLNFYLSSPLPVSDDSQSSHMSDEDLLDDLDSILSSQQVADEPEHSLSHIHIGYNPPADTLALAMSSSYQEGLFVVEDPSQPSQAEPAAATSPSPAATAKSAVSRAPSSGKRGRKRKASSESLDAESRKRQQNAEAAKKYRQRKAEQMNKVFEEKEGVEKELEKARKKLQSKLNERNILLKMLYESYKDGSQSAPHKILFPSWIETWYDRQKDD